MLSKRTNPVPVRAHKFGVPIAVLMSVPTAVLMSVPTAVLMSMLATGCGFSWATQRETNPVIHDWTVPNSFSSEESLELFATTASRREVLVKQDQHGGSIKTCAEPPPDVGEAFSAALAAGLQSVVSVSKGSDTKAAGELAGQFARQVTTQIAPLLYRSQGLQLNRDAQFALCIDLMNGDITNDQYVELKKDRFDKSYELINRELPNMKEVAVEYYKSVKAGSSIDSSTLKTLLDATKLPPPVAPTPPGEISPPAKKQADNPAPSKNP